MFISPRLTAVASVMVISGIAAAPQPLVSRYRDTVPAASVGTVLPDPHREWPNVTAIACDPTAVAGLVLHTAVVLLAILTATQPATPRQRARTAVAIAATHPHRHRLHLSALAGCTEVLLSQARLLSRSFLHLLPQRSSGAGPTPRTP